MAPRSIPELSWRPLGYGSPFRARILPSILALGALLEASRGPTNNLEAALGRPQAGLETRFTYLGGPEGPKKEPGRVPNRGPKTIQAENGETLIFNECLTKPFDF